MAGGGGAWKVAYADFVTAMMAFFMVMWLVGQSDKVKEAIAHEFNTPPSQRNKLRMHNRKRQLPTVPEKKLPSGQPAESQEGSKSRMVKGKFNPINMATLVFFADDSAELDNDARERLLRLVPWIAGKPQKIEIRGHASRRPLPPDSHFADAWQLCYARCRATVDFLVENGIPPERLRISQAAGYEPYTERVDPQWQARNSRVEVALLSELTAAAGIADATTSATASQIESPHP